MDERVEGALRGAALWDEVKDRLKRSALALSGGQQQRLCIARALAVEPEVILLDEPASALDPISTAAIEDLMHELKRDYTLVIVTHNMQQAARVADMTAFFSLEVDETASGTASSSSTTRPRRSSRTRPTSEPRTTSPGASDEASTFHRGARAAGGGAPARRATWSSARSARRSRRSTAATSELADEVIAFDDEVDTATSRSSRESRSCSRARRPSRSTCGSCSRCSARTSTSSGWRTTASRSRSWSS